MRTLRAANADMAFSTAFITLTTGAFLVGFVQLLGGTDVWIGVLTAIPSLFGLFQIPGAIWGRSFPSFKPFVTPGGALWRLLYIPLVALPLLPISLEAKLLGLTLFIALASAAIVIVNPTYSDWLAELVPADSRGFFFSRRNAVGTAVGSGVGLLGAVILDAFRAAKQDAIGFSVIYALGILCAAISMFFFLRMRDIPRPNPIRQSLKEGIGAIKTPFADRDYRPVLIFLAVAVVGQTLAGNLFAAFALKTLGLDYKVLQGSAVMYAIGIVIASRLWGYVSDRYGNRPVLTFACALLALNQLPWIFCVPGANFQNAILLLVTHVFMGFTWSAVALCQFNLMLATAKPTDRANYIAAGMTVVAVFSGLAPLAGGVMATEFRHFTSPEWAYKLVFLIVMAIRLVTVFFLGPVKEPNALTFKQTFRDLRQAPRGIRALRELSRGGDAREAAIQSVGEQRVGLASDEIIKALHDPIPRVRRQAASALARLSDPRAVRELVHQVEEHPDLLEEETVEALGDIGDAAAVPALIRTLESPRSVLRRAAAKALGRIGSRDAVEALMRSSQEPGDVDLRRASIQALRIIGDPEAASVVLSALMDPHPSVRIAAAEAVAELELAEAAATLRLALQTFADEASAELAYALGAVGDESDLTLILAEAARCESIITSRRCLLGAARRLGVERDAYRLLLLEGIERDTRLLEKVRPLVRRKPWIAEALDAYSVGDEPRALAVVAKHRPDLAPFAATPVPEAFLVISPVLG